MPRAANPTRRIYRLTFLVNEQIATGIRSEAGFGDDANVDDYQSFLEGALDSLRHYYSKVGLSLATKQDVDKAIKDADEMERRAQEILARASEARQRAEDLATNAGTPLPDGVSKPSGFDEDDEDD